MRPSVILPVLCSLWVTSAAPEKGLLEHLLRVSYSKCIRKCAVRQRCVYAKYMRHTTLCLLFHSQESMVSVPGVLTYSKSAPQNNTCDPENEHCSKLNWKSCSDPEKIIGTEILGNMVQYGAKLKYECVDGTGSAVSECLANGTWSHNNLKCACSKPLDENNIPVENVAFWSFHKTDMTHVTAFPTCKNGYSLRENVTAICDVLSGVWSSLGDICCEKLTEGAWIKVFSLPSSNTTSGIMWSWFYTSENKYCQYRNDSVIDNWDTNTPPVVNITVLKNNAVVNWVAFDGKMSSMNSWMNGSNILSSSWSTVSAENADELVAKIRNNFLQFFVGTTVPGYRTGWLGVARHNFTNPKLLLRKTFIIYSLSNDSLDMNVFDIENGSFGLADRMEIWTFLP